MTQSAGKPQGTPSEGALVTVVMAAYNAEKHITRAVLSILDQDIENWELICIDDGSIDRTYEILKNFAEHERRIRLFQQENKGPASARYIGYKHGIGDYYVMLDADDWVEERFLSSLLSLATATNADTVMSDLHVRAADQTWYSFSDSQGLQKGDTYSGTRAFALTFPWQIHGVCLWRAKLIKSYATDPSDTENPYNSDEFLSRKLLLHSNKVVYGTGKYFYETNSDSITNKISYKRFYRLETQRRLAKLARSRDVTEDVMTKVLQYQRAGILECAILFGQFGGFGRTSFVLAELYGSISNFHYNCATTGHMQFLPNFVTKLLWSALRGYLARFGKLKSVYRKLHNNVTVNKLDR